MSNRRDLRAFLSTAFKMYLCEYRQGLMAENKRSKKRLKLWKPERTATMQQKNKSNCLRDDSTVQPSSALLIPDYVGGSTAKRHSLSSPTFRPEQLIRCLISRLELSPSCLTLPDSPEQRITCCNRGYFLHLSLFLCPPSCVN